MKPNIHLIHLEHYPIFAQLQLEEALLRVDNRNWCLINAGSPPAIVMGISGQPDQLICKTSLKNNPLPVIRRFSGGGTVVVDPNTIFVTFIFNSSEIGVPCYPHPVFQWSETFYKTVFGDLDFKLHENDYVIGSRKFGGNAQYMRKERWLHHTSLLWDFDTSKMSHLLMPAKTPSYREGRAHHDFLCKLSDLMDSKKELQDRVLNSLNHHFQIQHVSLQDAMAVTETPHRKATAYVDGFFI